MKIPRQKITAAQQHELLQVYLHLGLEPSAELSREYGVSPNYAMSHAGALGLAPRRKHRGGGSIAKRVDHSDPRWARALAIGVVVV
jgi:hypothetical protein